MPDRLLDAVAFIQTKTECHLARRYYPDLSLARVLLSDFGRLSPELPDVNLWIDAGTDGLGDYSARSRPTKDGSLPANAAWLSTVRRFRHHDVLETGSLTSAMAAEFVEDAMNACLRHNPSAVSVPQIPYGIGAERNRTNKLLAKATADWRRRSPGVVTILPVILKSPKQTVNKVARNKRVSLAAECLETSGADVLWAVDSSFSDEEGGTDSRREKIKTIVCFHEELNAKVGSVKTEKLAGPYWLLNLVLWCRGLIDTPAISIGHPFCYYISGGRPASTNAAYLPIEPLCRRAMVGAALGKWFAEVLAQLSPSHPFHDQFAMASHQASSLGRPAARERTAIVYRRWLDELADLDSPGRSMYLYQQLTAAYGFGRQIKQKLEDEDVTRQPESIAEGLMLSCL